MADTSTSTYGLTKPEISGSENTWGTKTNTNWDSVDDLLDGTTVLTGTQLDDTMSIVDNADNTKIWQVQLSGITASTTRTWTVPDSDDTFVGLAATQTLTNKTLTAPTINGGASVTTNGSMYATYGGTANVVTLTTGASLSSLTTGQEFRFRATAANTGATTINVDAIGALTAKTPTGAALPAGFIRTDVDTVCRYDGTDIIVSRAVEEGSGANGYWTRWEDGTQICGLKLFQSTYVNTAHCSATWTFPAAFGNVNIEVVATPKGAAVNSIDANATPGPGDLGSSGIGNLTATAADIGIMRVTGTTNFQSGDYVYMSVTAYGRWY